MTEFDITEWSDFVRGVADPELADRMREHLESAPARSHRMVAALRHVAEVGRSDADSPVPDHAVRIVKAIASTPRASGQESAERTSGASPSARSILRRLLCTVTFDSRLQPAPAGTRDLEGSHRHLVLEADSYRIDIRLEQEMEPPSVVAVGQITGQDEDRPLARVPVLVFSGQDEVGHAVTSQYGEFQFEGLPRRDLDLCLIVGEDFLEVSLDREPGVGQGAHS